MDGFASPPPELIIDGLAKRFGDVVAVDGLSFEVQPGEVFGLLGPNGAGKTTAINLIAGMLRPDAGRVVIGSAPGAAPREVRSLVGVCPQKVVLWGKLTCLEQLILIAEMYDVPPRVGRGRASTLLDALGLADKRDRLARTLSGGMQRRLNLAMALVHDPPLVVLDEPEAGLDPQSRVMVRDYIRSLRRRKTIILTTHNMDEADRLADRVAIIDHGRLLVLDRPEELKRRAGEGDVLEVDLQSDGSAGERAAAAVRALGPGSDVTVADGVLVVRALVGDLTNPQYLIAAPLADAVIDAYCQGATGWLRPVQVAEEALGTSGVATDLDSYTPGLIIFSVIMLIFPASMSIARESEAGTLDRLRLSRLTSLQYLAGISGAQVLIGLVSVVLSLAAAKAVGFHSQGPLWVAVAIGAVTAISVVGVGLIVAAFSRTSNEAFVIANFPLMLLMFFSGSIFPISKVAVFTVAGRTVGLFDLLPPTHAVAALNKVLTYGSGLGGVSYELGALALLSAAYFAAGVSLFQRRQMGKGAASGGR
ncbi:MAG TPA: ATP-binding cassette domain-containing protein [Bacillota bacterium]